MKAKRYDRLIFMRMVKYNQLIHMKMHVRVRFKAASSRFVRENLRHVSQRIEKHGDDETTFQVDVAEPREVM